MIATAKSQSLLKAEAGIKNTGRSSNKHVMHYVLSWSPEEYHELTRQEMVDAALASLTYLGTTAGERLGKNRVATRTQYASEHQALIVCHDEGPDKPLHVHVMVNRVHPEHGVMVSDSKDYEKLSAWALDYRRAQHKEHLCPQRVVNAARRAQGVLTSHPRKPRNAFEQDQAISEAADPARKARLDQLRKRGKSIKAKSEMAKITRKNAMAQLEQAHLAAARSVRTDAANTGRVRRSEIRSIYAERIEALARQQAAEMEAFHMAKRHAAGRVRNAWTAFQTRDWMKEMRVSPGGAIKQGFALAFSSGLQELGLRQHHATEQVALHQRQRTEERKASRAVHADVQERLDALRQAYLRDRQAMVLDHQVERIEFEAQWRELAVERRDVQTGLDHARSTLDGKFNRAAGSGDVAEDRSKGGEVDLDGLLSEQFDRADQHDQDPEPDR